MASIKAGKKWYAIEIKDEAKPVVCYTHRDWKDKVNSSYGVCLLKDMDIAIKLWGPKNIIKVRVEDVKE